MLIQTEGKDDLHNRDCPAGSVVAQSAEGSF